MIKILYIFLFGLFSFTASAQLFSEVSSSANINFSREQLFLIGGGVTILDYDNDSWEDFFVPGGYGSCALFRNKGDASFENVTQTQLDSLSYLKIDSLFITGSIAGDIDNDGDKDLFLLTAGLKIHSGVIMQACVLLENRGPLGFVDISLSAGISQASYSVAATMGDYNGDGYLDIYVSNYIESMTFTYDNQGNQTAYVPECRPNYFYINQGDGTFVESAAAMGLDDKGCSLTATFSNYDLDEDVDLLLANDFGAWSGYANVLYNNQFPVDSFENRSALAGFNRAMYGMGIAAGDYDEDGDLDYYLTNIGRNSLYKNNNDGTFVDVATAAAVDNKWSVPDSLRKTSWGCNFLDFDNDTHLDLFVANGYVESFLPPTTILDSNKLFKNTGLGYFTDVSDSSGLVAPTSNRGAAVFDYDHDGDMDIIVNHCRLQTLNNSFVPQYLFLYQNNNQNNNNWLKVQLDGRYGQKDGYGSLIKIYVGNRSFIREIDGGSSHASQNSSIAHFGLANATSVDSMIVYWLNGEAQKIYNISPNQTLIIQQTEPAALKAVSPWMPKMTVYPNLITSTEALTMAFELDQAQAFDFKLTNTTGQLLWQQKKILPAGQSSLNLPKLQLGNASQVLYLIITDQKGNSKPFKIACLRE